MRIIPGRMLAPVGWFGTTPLDPARFQAPELSPIEWTTIGTKPFPGGLWTSPIKRSGFPPRPVGTTWTLHDGRSGLPFTEVVPADDAKIVVVSTRAELAEVVQRWPDTREDLDHRNRHDRLFRTFTPYKVNWSAMAADVDGFYATSAAFAGAPLDSLNFPVDKPHLWGWDVPTVLFLRPSFTAGPVHGERAPRRREGAHRWI